jgi:hypothetical protein
MKIEDVWRVLILDAETMEPYRTERKKNRISMVTTMSLLLNISCG